MTGDVVQGPMGVTMVTGEGSPLRVTGLNVHSRACPASKSLL